MKKLLQKIISFFKKASLKKSNNATVFLTTTGLLVSINDKQVSVSSPYENQKWSWIIDDRSIVNNIRELVDNGELATAATKAVNAYHSYCQRASSC